MIAYSNAEEEFAQAACLLSRAARILDKIAKKDPAIWKTFEARFAEAGAERIEEIADECDLVSLLVAQDSGKVRNVARLQVISI